MTIHWKAVEQYFTEVLFVVLENLSILDLVLSGVKGLTLQRLVQYTVWFDPQTVTRKPNCSLMKPTARSKSTVQDAT